MWLLRLEEWEPVGSALLDDLAAIFGEGTASLPVVLRAIENISLIERMLIAKQPSVDPVALARCLELANTCRETLREHARGLLR